MKKKIGFFLWLTVCVLCTYSQGIQFQEDLSWKEAKEKARQEHKYIFVDCYATWCGPCKMMDKEVYPDAKLGDFVNAHFIAIKVQIDQAKTDNKRIRSRYMEAKEIQAEYKITELPTFLFFDPEGKIVHRDVGYHDTVDFLHICTTAMDPSKNFNGLLEQYRTGKLKGKKLLELAMSAKKFKDDSLALQIARRYRKTVLDEKFPAKLLTPEQLSIIQNFPQLYTINDKLITYIYKNQGLANKGFKQSGMASRIVDYMISRDIIGPLIKDTLTTPNWQNIQKKVAGRFDSRTAYRNIVYTKLDWYQQKKDWDNFIKTWIKRIDNLGIDMKSLGGGVEVNNTVYDIIFKYSTDPYALKKAVQYMEALIKVSPESYNRLDTYANILYKSGQKGKAIETEKHALSMVEESTVPDSSSVELFKQVIAKMEKDEPTW